MRNGRITINPEIRFGKPIIRGTRITVSDILGLIAAGYAIKDIPNQYPELTNDDIVAAIEFVSQFIEHPTQTISQL